MWLVPHLVRVLLAAYMWIWADDSSGWDEIKIWTDFFMFFWSFALRVALIHIDIVTQRTHRLSKLNVCRVMLGEAGGIGPLAAVMWGPALCECLMWPKEVVITADLPPASHHCAPSPPPTTNTRGVLNQILLSSRFVYIRSGFGKSTFSYCTDIIVKKCFLILTHPRMIPFCPQYLRLCHPLH